jgi:PAS domain S-box-containing protein
MNSLLRVLHLEDDVTDTELLRATLEREGIQAELTRVETGQDFLAAVKDEDVDLILADYSLPSFDGLSALKIAQEHASDVPFIFVSGKLGEDVAIEALKTGATDYVLKTHLVRLAPAVNRALREAREKMERKRAEQQLSLEQQRFMDMVNTVEGIVWEADAETFKFTFVNKQAERILGYPVERWLQEPTFWKDHLHPEDRDWAVQFCANATADKRDHDFEYRMIAADGRTVWLRDLVTVVVQGNRPTRIRGVMVDATERKRAEEAVHRSEKQLRLVIDTIPAMAWSTLPSGANDYCSKGWLEYTGMKLGAEFDYGWLDAFHPEDRAAHLAKWRVATETGELFENVARIRGSDGEYRWFLTQGVPLRDESGKIVRWYGTNVDIDERKRAQSLLEGEKRLLEMIATGVPLKEILNALCLIIEEQRSGTLASILLLNPDGVHLDFVAGAKLPKEWTRQMEKMPIGPCAGSCGTAAYRGSAVIVSDITTDPLWDVPEHRASALKHGLQASWSSPVLSFKGKVLGTFCLYYREPRSPTSEDLELIELATHLVRVAIERDRAEEALRASEQVVRGQVEALIYSLDVLATAPAPDKFIGQMLSTIGRLLNAQGVTLWLFDESMDSLVLRLMTDGGKLVAPDPDHPFMKDRLFWKKNPAIQELLFTSGPVVCEDIETDPRVYGEWREYLKRKGAKRFLAVPLLVGGQVRGFVGIRHPDRAAYRPEEIELTQALAHQVMLAIQLNEFAEQGQRAAVFEERNRMARDIHDTLAQGFTGVIVQLEAAEDAFSCGYHKEANNHLHRAGELARRSLSEARRSVHALRPQALQEHNFWDALKGIIKNTTVATALHTKFEAQGKLPELPRAWQENLLHIGQEALTNTLKYAHARNFETRLSYKANELFLELRDDGDGFKVKERHDGVGLTGMRERVEQMGGELKITSSRGKGTKITVVLPCNGESTT